MAESGYIDTGKKKRIEVLNDTLDAIRNESYKSGGKTRYLNIVPDRITRSYVFLPKDIQNMERRLSLPEESDVKTKYLCRNMDSFSMAEEFEKNRHRHGKPVLVLNFASAFAPGGGVRIGAAAQEEELCRRSTLLVALDAEDAERYYYYNRRLQSLAENEMERDRENTCWQALYDFRAGSDAVMITPNVLVLKDENYQYLGKPFETAVMTCAAPDIRKGMGSLSGKEYKALLRKRIHGMITAAYTCGYKNLVLGAWGCGVYGNDAKDIANIFYSVLKEFKNAGFENVGFAVLDNTPGKYNCNSFKKVFRD